MCTLLSWDTQEWATQRNGPEWEWDTDYTGRRMIIGHAPGMEMGYTYRMRMGHMN